MTYARGQMKKDGRWRMKFMGSPQGFVRVARAILSPCGSHPSADPIPGADPVAIWTWVEARRVRGVAVDDSVTPARGVYIAEGFSRAGPAADMECRGYSCEGLRPNILPRSVHAPTGIPDVCSSRGRGRRRFVVGIRGWLSSNRACSIFFSAWR